MILQAFFDASSRPKTSVFCVAGFVFRKLQLQKFDRDWRRLFGKYGGCHMKELAHSTGRFKGIDRTEQARLIKEAVAILRKRAAHGIVVACFRNEMNRVLPTWIRGFEGAFPACCHIAMTALGYKLARHDSDDRVAYVFENGDEYSGCAQQFMDLATDKAGIAAGIKESYRHASHSFVDKDDALALQAADLLAWESAKFFEETAVQGVRPMRLSLAHLLADRDMYFDLKRFDFRLVTGEPLRKWAAEVHALGLQQRAEDEARKNRPS